LPQRFGAAGPSCSKLDFGEDFSMNCIRLALVSAVFSFVAATSGLAGDAITLKAGSRYAQSDTKKADCVQVISCGTKNGVRKEYKTPCDAKDDGATDVSPKVGPTCEASK
jgi:hypothetical protein